MDIEFKKPEEIKAFQEGLMKEALEYLQANSPYYRHIFNKHGIDIKKITKIEDLQKFPFTEKNDLQKYNEDFFCCPKSKIVDYVTTSGTTGDPIIFGCTEKDLRRLAFNEKKSFECAGLKPGDLVQIMVTLDKRFMAGNAYFMGIRELGASAVRVGNGIPELQWDTINRLKPDTIMCVPSFILRLIQWAEDHGVDYTKSSIKRIIGIGEGLRDQNFKLNLLGSRIKEKWDVQLFATYSSTEMSATFSECPCGCGGHLHPELVIVEIIGEDDKPVPDGEVGEVVITTLGVEGMPLLRYRTGDLAAKVTGKCQCGRYSYRLTPIMGRKHNMLKLKGTTLYPPAIYDVLDNAHYIENYVVIVQDSDAGLDDVIVKVGLKYQPDFDVIKDIKDRFRSRIRVAPKVEIHPSNEIAAINYPAKSRKPIKFIDNREKHV